MLEMEDDEAEPTKSETTPPAADRRHLFGKRFSATQSTIPDIPDEGILLQTLFAGVRQLKCNVDSTQECSFSTGYELCGRVVTVGRSVTADCPIKEGDVVLVYPWPGCGRCEICSSGNSHLCEDPGSEDIPDDNTASASLATTQNSLSLNFAAIQEWKNVVRLPREIPPYIGCTLPYGALKIYAAILEARPILEQAVRARGFGNLLIIGGAGDASELWAVILMKHIFCDKNVKVICADQQQSRLDRATRLGADDAVLWQRGASVEEMVEDATMSAYNKMDVAIDLVGDATTFAVAWRSLHYGGALLELGGGDEKKGSPNDFRIDLPMSTLVARALTVKAIRAGSKALLKQLVDHVSMLGSSVELPMEYYCVAELDVMFDKLKRGEVNGRAIVRYE